MGKNREEGLLHFTVLKTTSGTLHGLVIFHALLHLNTIALHCPLPLHFTGDGDDFRGATGFPKRDFIRVEVLAEHTGIHLVIMYHVLPASIGPGFWRKL